MAQTREFPVSWSGVYSSRLNRYDSGNYVWVGGSEGYNSFLGFPSSVRDALQTSKTTPRLYLKMNVVDAGEFDVGAHKESSNKAYGSLPWYRYIGLHPNFGTGVQQIDLTSAFMNDYKNGTYKGIVLYGAIGAGFGASSAVNSGSIAPKVIVEGTWNTPPNKPSIISPVSSTVAEDNLTVTWSHGGDAEQSDSQLKYYIKIKDAFGNWSNAYISSAGATSYTIDVSDMSETSSSQIAIQAYDGELFSGYAYSQSFTISHNRPPAQPSNLNPSSGEPVNRENSVRLSWRHNDETVQAGYRVRWRRVGTSTWTYIPSSSGITNTTNQYHNFSANYFPESDIEWQVLTSDQKGLLSPWSNTQRFKATPPTDAPIFLSPTNNSLINSSQPVVSWSSINQSAYELQLLDSTGAELWRIEKSSTVKSRELGYSLENNKDYTIKLRVLSSTVGLWSTWSTINVTTQFTPPEKPSISSESSSSSGSITVSWVSDPTGSSLTATDYIDLFRREYNDFEENEWVRIASGMSPVGSWSDLTPASDTVYEYKARAYGDNETSIDSDTTEESVTIEHAIIQRSTSLSDSIRILTGDSRSQDIEFSGQSLSFANRVKPVYEFGVNEENKLNVSWTVDTKEEKSIILKMIRRKETLLYRDNNGRRIFCVAIQPKIVDRPIRGFDFSLELLEVDYEEGV